MSQKFRDGVNNLQLFYNLQLLTDVARLIRKGHLSFRVFKYSFLTELFFWQN